MSKATRNARRAAQNVDQTNVDQIGGNVDQTNVDAANDGGNVDQTNVDQTNVDQTNVDQTNVDQPSNPFASLISLFRKPAAVAPAAVAPAAPAATRTIGLAAIADADKLRDDDGNIVRYRSNVPNVKPAERPVKHGIATPAYGGDCHAAWKLADDLSFYTLDGALHIPTPVEVVMANASRSLGLTPTNVDYEARRWRIHNGFPAAPRATRK